MSAFSSLRPLAPSSLHASLMQMSLLKRPPWTAVSMTVAYPYPPTFLPAGNSLFFVVVDRFLIIDSISLLVIVSTDFFFL